MKGILLFIFLAFVFWACDKDEKECTSKSDCSPWQVCSDNNECIKANGRCDKDEDCQGDKKCNDSHICVSMCRENSDCESYQQCNNESKKCELKEGMCSKNDHCLEYEKCTADNRCVLKEGSCREDSDCENIADKPICDKYNHKCIEEEADVCKDFTGCEDIPNTVCKANPKGEPACYCKDGYMVNPNGSGCIEKPECTDDNIGNSREDATVITIPYEGAHKICPGNIDFFKFPMNAGEYIIIKSTSDEEYSMFLYKGENLLLSGPSIFYKTEESGDFYLLVRTQGIKANYEVKLTRECENNANCGGGKMFCNASKMCEEHQCNDDNIGNSAEDATEITIPYDAQNKVCTEKPDFYKLDLNEGDNIVIQVKNLPQNEWVLMELYGDVNDPTDDALPEPDGEEKSLAWGSRERKLIYHVTETKTYYIKVYKTGLVDLNYNLLVKDTCIDDTECDGTFNYCDPDTNKCSSGQCVDDNIGNTPESASLVTIPYEQEHVICSSQPDYFKFNLEVGESITVKASFSNREGDLDIELYQGMPSGNNIVAESKTPKNEEKLSFIAESAGEYYLKVYPFVPPNSTELIENIYNLSIKKECQSHDDCTEDKYCASDKKCTIYPNCTQDSDCESISSIDNDSDFYCKLPNTYKASCNLHIAPSCGEDGSNKSSLATNLTLGENKTSVLCLIDEDWYKFSLTENTTDLNVTLSFDKGKFDLSILGPNNAYPHVLYLENQRNTPANGVDVKMLPAGDYYVHIKRHKNWNTNDELELINYTLNVSKTGNTECSADSCLTLVPKRSTCNDTTKACETTIEDFSIPEGGTCDNLMDCEEVENLHACHAGICVTSCESAGGCKNGFVCQSLGFLIRPKVCIENCTNKPENYCKDILSKDSAYCDTDNGKCK